MKRCPSDAPVAMPPSTSDDVIVSARAKRRRIGSTDQGNAELQRIDSAQKDDPALERPGSDRQEEERLGQKELEEDQRERQETLSNGHEKPGLPTLERDQPSFSYLVRQCLSSFSKQVDERAEEWNQRFNIQSNQLALEKGEKDRLRHLLDEKTLEARRYDFFIETRDKKIVERDKQLENRDKQLEERNKELKDRDKQLENHDRQLKDRDRQLEDRDKQLEVAKENFLRIKRQYKEMCTKKKKLDEKLSKIKIVCGQDDEDDENENSDGS